MTRSVDPKADRPQTPGEEIANAVSHGLGFVLALASLPILVTQAALHGGPWDIAGASVFAGTMILLYLVSALYHATPAGSLKRRLNRLDHAAIYLFIAGSYTPFTLGVLKGPWGWTLFAIVWSIAIVGVAVKLLNLLKHPLASTALYVAMGWVAVVAAAPLLARMPIAGLAWLMIGGLSYTVGAIVFLFDHRIRYGHFIWHIFVLGGSVSHFLAALWYSRG